MREMSSAPEGPWRGGAGSLEQKCHRGGVGTLGQGYGEASSKFDLELGLLGPWVEKVLLREKLRDSRRVMCDGRKKGFISP